MYLLRILLILTFKWEMNKSEIPILNGLYIIIMFLIQFINCCVSPIIQILHIFFFHRVFMYAILFGICWKKILWIEPLNIYSKLINNLSKIIFKILAILSLNSFGLKHMSIPTNLDVHFKHCTKKKSRLYFCIP